MQTIKIKVRGVGPVEYQVTSDAAEWDKIGGPGSCHKDAISNVLYRGPYGDLAEGLAEWVEQKLPNLQRTREARTNKDGSVAQEITEGHEGYFKRVIASGKLTATQLTEQLQKLAADPEFAFTEYVKTPTRRAKVKTLRVSKDIIEQVRAIVAAGKAGALATAIGKRLGRVVEPTEAALGQAIAEDIKRELDKAHDRVRAEIGL